MSFTILCKLSFLIFYCKEFPLNSPFYLWIHEVRISKAWTQRKNEWLFLRTGSVSKITISFPKKPRFPHQVRPPSKYLHLLQKKVLNSYRLKLFLRSQITLKWPKYQLWFLYINVNKIMARIKILYLKEYYFSFTVFYLYCLNYWPHYFINNDISRHVLEYLYTKISLN